MKYITTAIVLAASTIPMLRAETPTEREFKLLQDQRNKAIAVASEPINRRYQTALEQLLRRATQANDLETALKIKQEIGASATSATPDSKSEFTTWLQSVKLSHNQPGHGLIDLTFNRKVAVSATRAGNGVSELAFKVIQPRIVEIEGLTLTFAEDLKTYSVLRRDNKQTWTGAVAPKEAKK